MKNKNTLILVAIFCSLISSAQVGIGTTTPDGNAILDVVSTTQGILFPRMDAQQRNAISSPSTGLTIFNTDLNRVQTNTGTSSVPSWKNWYNGAQPGSTYTQFYTGGTNGDVFSTNATCTTKLISAQGCDGLTSVTGASGTVYSLVNINGQCWMTTNLNELPNGVAINASQWLATTPGNLGYYGYYNTDTTDGSAGWATSAPAADEGLLYQWSAAMVGSNTERAQGVCPTGFHIPSDCEWMYLEHGQGMLISQQTADNVWRTTTNEGYKLRAVGGSFTNTSGFTALLAGVRISDGVFANRESVGHFWSSSQTNANFAQRRSLDTAQAGVLRFNSSKANSYSVRCLRD